VTPYPSGSEIGKGRGASEGTLGSKSDSERGEGKREEGERKNGRGSGPEGGYMDSKVRSRRPPHEPQHSHRRKLTAAVSQDLTVPGYPVSGYPDQLVPASVVPPPGSASAESQRIQRGTRRPGAASALLVLLLGTWNPTPGRAHPSCQVPPQVGFTLPARSHPR